MTRLSAVTKERKPEEVFTCSGELIKPSNTLDNSSDVVTSETWQPPGSNGSAAAPISKTAWSQSSFCSLLAK